ncbi:MAG: nucleotidyltransferase family protein [Bacteroidales bacterium]|nr:nucleotidyltransferase family protein [Bacteroidales bacterium]
MNAMPPAEKALLALVQAGLWEDASCLDGLLQAEILTEKQWQAVTANARRQAVTGLLQRGVQLMPETHTPPFQTCAYLLVEAERIAQSGEKVRTRADELIALLQCNGIPSLLQKGPAVAACYAVPQARMAGDIDLYLPPDHFEKGREFFLAHDVQGHDATDGSFCFEWKGVIVELHRQFFSFGKSFERRCAACLSTDGFHSPEASLLLQITHIFKHVAGCGIGLKQLCDLARTRLALADVCPPERLAGCLRKTGLVRWNRTLDAFLWTHLGGDRHLPMLHAPARRDIAHADRLLAYIWHDGNFGHDLRTAKKTDTLRGFIRHAAFSASQAPAAYGRLLSSYVRF